MSFRMRFQAEPPGNFDTLEARLALGKLLDGHLFFQTILKILKGRPTRAVDPVAPQRPHRRSLRSRPLMKMSTDVSASAATEFARTPP
jgi:hypothetical protein